MLLLGVGASFNDSSLYLKSVSTPLFSRMSLSLPSAPQNFPLGVPEYFFKVVFGGKLN